MDFAVSKVVGAPGPGPGPHGATLKARLAELVHACSTPNLAEAQLVECAIARGEGRLSSGGAFVVDTGQHTGRSPKDKFIVREAATEDLVWWDNNGAMTRQSFQRLFEDVLEYVAGTDLFVQDLFGGAGVASRLRVRVYTEYAWHSLFIRNLLIRPTARELEGFEPEMTIIDVPGFKVRPERYGVRSETVIAFDLVNRVVLIAGTAYAGEMKKSVFTMLNCLLPDQGVMPMHCSANIGADGRSALFFGLSGTGKTTLSATPDRTLVGDDEHGWGDDGIFNFEGGCYAKTIRLSAAAEPQIHAAALRFGTVLENVSLDPRTGLVDFDDDSRTENTRAAYPLPFIANASATGRGTHPSNVVMLTADAFGVLPPIARLTPEQAIYHFLAGFTAKLAGTERGVTEPQPTFSTCFGAPFLPLPPRRYAELLEEKIRRHAPTCWLVNTGWTGGPYGVGHRMRIDWTRALLDAAIGGGLADADFRRDPVFGFDVPVAAAGVPAESLDPRATWPDPTAYDAQARRLAALFRENFSKFDTALRRFEDAGPKAG